MALIDIFRPKPKWQHKDANVRAEAVRDLPASEQDLLQSIARADLDARVRRLAVKKLRDTAILIEIARQDGDTLVREEAQNALLNEALKDGQAQARALALEALSEPRHFALAARTAALAEIRLKALDLLSDAKLIAGVAREAQDAAVRLRALGRVQDAAALLSIAVGCEFKDAALLALERIRDRDALKTIATRAKSKAAMRRARALLGALAEEAHALTPSERHRHQSDICRRLDELMRHHEWSQVGDALKAAQAEWEQCAPADPELAPRYATLVRALEAGLARYQQGLPQVEAKTPRPPQTDAARALIERVRVLAGASLEEDLERLQAEWAGLQLPTGAEGDTLQEQYTQTVADARGRVASAAPAVAAEPAAEVVSDEQIQARLGELCAEAERVVALEDHASARAQWRDFEKQWRDAASSGRPSEELAARCEAARKQWQDRAAALRAEQEQKEKENLARLTALCDEFEPIARNEEASLRDSERALREARQILDQPGPLPSRQDRESLLARFEAIRRTLYPRVSALRQDDEWRRWANAGVQEELCARAEALAGRDDYEQIARELRDLDAHWKQARHVQKDQGEAVWARFKAARDQARQRCDAFFAEQAEIHAKNLKLKEDLCAQAEALAGAQEFAKTAEQLRALQQQWKQIGPVSKGHNQAIWQRFRKACDAFFERFKKHRAERTAQWAENLAKKTALIEQAEALVASIEWERAASEIKRLQAEWKAIGPVRKSQSEPIWQRFRTASDAFFERYKHRDSLEREARLKQRQALVGELEALVPADGSAAIAPDGLAQKVAELQAAWRQCGPLPKEGGVELNQRMTDAVRRLIEIFPQSFAGTDLDPEATRRKMERLCARVEALIAELLPAGAESGDLAQQLKNALAANTMGGKAEREVRFKAAVQEVENAQAAWKRLGPVPAALARTLEERFESACARFFAQRHKPSHKA